MLLWLPLSLVMPLERYSHYMVECSPHSVWLAVMNHIVLDLLLQTIVCLPIECCIAPLLVWIAAGT